MNIKGRSLVIHNIFVSRTEEEKIDIYGIAESFSGILHISSMIVREQLACLYVWPFVHEIYGV